MIIRPLGTITGVALIAFLAVFWIAWIVALFLGLPIAGYVLPGSNAAVFLGVFNILVILGIPILMLILTVMRLFLRTQFKPRWRFGVWAFWFVNLVSFFLLGTMTAKQFSHGDEFEMGTNMPTVSSDTLIVEMEESPYRDTWFSLGDELYVSDEELVSGHVDINFERSPSGIFEIVQENASRGSSLGEVKRLSENIRYEYRLEGNKLILPSYIVLKNGEKWRDQHVIITVKVPDGKFVKPNRSARQSTWHIDEDKNYRFPWYRNDYIWQMTPSGMIAPDYISEYQQEFPFKNFSKIRTEGEVKLRIRQGDRYHIDLNRGSRYAEDLDMSQSGDRLNIRLDTDPHEGVMLEITVPDLKELWAISSDDIDIRDFKMEKLRIVNEGEAEIKIFADIDSLRVELSGNSELDLRGEGTYLEAYLSNYSEMDAEHFQVKNAKVEVIEQSEAKILVTDTLRQKVINGELDSRGNPVIIHWNQESHQHEEEAPAEEEVQEQAEEQ